MFRTCQVKGLPDQIWDNLSIKINIDNKRLLNKIRIHSSNTDEKEGREVTFFLTVESQLINVRRNSELGKNAI